MVAGPKVSGRIPPKGWVLTLTVASLLLWRLERRKENPSLMDSGNNPLSAPPAPRAQRDSRALLPKSGLGVGASFLRGRGVLWQRQETLVGSNS